VVARSEESRACSCGADGDSVVDDSSNGCPSKMLGGGHGGIGVTVSMRYGEGGDSSGLSLLMQLVSSGVFIFVMSLLLAEPVPGPLPCRQ
jgi:hypothetical protein